MVDGEENKWVSVGGHGLKGAVFAVDEVELLLFLLLLLFY